MNFHLWIENICIRQGSTLKVIYISTNTSDKLGVNATVFTPLKEKNSYSLIFFFWVNETNKRVFQKCGYVLLKMRNFRKLLHYL